MMVMPAEPAVAIDRSGASKTEGQIDVNLPDQKHLKCVLIACCCQKTSVYWPEEWLTLLSCTTISECCLLVGQKTATSYRCQKEHIACNYCRLDTFSCDFTKSIKDDGITYTSYHAIGDPCSLYLFPFHMCIGTALFHLQKC
jgi:hypothetical protein